MVIQVARDVVAMVAEAPQGAAQQDVHPAVVLMEIPLVKALQEETLQPGDQEETLQVEAHQEAAPQPAARQVRVRLVEIQTAKNLRRAVPQEIIHPAGNDLAQRVVLPAE